MGNKETETKPAVSQFATKISKSSVMSSNELAKKKSAENTAKGSGSMHAGDAEKNGKRRPEESVTGCEVISVVLNKLVMVVVSLFLWLGIYSIPFSWYYDTNYNLSMGLFVLNNVLQMPLFCFGGVYWMRTLLGLRIHFWSLKTWMPILVYEIATLALYVPLYLYKEKSWPIPFLPVWGGGLLYFTTVVPTVYFQIEREIRAEPTFKKRFLTASIVPAITNFYYFVLLAFYIAISSLIDYPVLQIGIHIIFHIFAKIFFVLRTKAIRATTQSTDPHELTAMFMLNSFELGAAAEVYFSIVVPHMRIWVFIIARGTENLLMFYHLFEDKIRLRGRLRAFSKLLFGMDNKIKKVASVHLSVDELKTFEFDWHMGRYFIHWLCEAFGIIYFVVTVPSLYYGPNSAWFGFRYDVDSLIRAIAGNLISLVPFWLNFLISWTIIKRKYNRDLLKFGTLLLQQKLVRIMLPALCCLVPVHLYCQLGYHWNVVWFLENTFHLGHSIG